MPITYKYNNGQSYQIPDIGEIFLDPNGGLNKRTGNNTFVSLSRDVMSNVDKSSLGQLATYNPGEVANAIGQDRSVPTSTNDIGLFQNYKAPTSSNGVIDKTFSALGEKGTNFVNPNAAMQTKALAGALPTAPTAPLASAGGGLAGQTSSLSQEMEKARQQALGIKSGLDTLTQKGYGNTDTSQLPQNTQIADIPAIGQAKAMSGGGTPATPQAPALAKAPATGGTASAGTAGPGGTDYLQKLYELVAAQQTPSATETSTQEQLDALTAQQSGINASRDLGIQAVGEQPIAMPFISGQQAALTNRAAVQTGALGAQAVPLSTRLAREQAKRQASMDVAKTGLDYGFKSEQLNLEKQKAQQQEGYTLGEGQQRYDSSGKLIASGPAKATDTLDNAYKAAQIRKIDADIKAAGAGEITPEKMKTQLNLITRTLGEAKKLADASGRSGARRTLEAWTVGSTDYTNLVALTNTIRTNVLTIATDPSIKKFFGPQMSNADVQLMTSAGTTLNPELQSPEKMKEEIIRLEEVLTRLSGGSQAPGGGKNVVTAGTDGTSYGFPGYVSDGTQWVEKPVGNNSGWVGMSPR